MINFLVGLQSPLVQLVNELLLAPDNVPIIALCPLVSLLLKSIANAVREVCFELYFRSVFAILLHLAMVLLFDIPEK